MHYSNGINHTFQPIKQEFNGVDMTSISLAKHLTEQAENAEEKM
jgi:hypothetical protein